MLSAEESDHAVIARARDLTTLAQIIQARFHDRWSSERHAERVAEMVQRWLLKGEWPL
jgi:hypothetical protein